MSKLAVHYIPIHDRAEDKEYIRRTSPYCLKLVYSSKPDVGHVRQMLGLLDLPRATVILRDHALSEQKDDVKRDARGTGERHAKEWDETLAKLMAETPLAQAERILVTGINEPTVWQEISPWVLYTVAFMDTLKEAHAAALNLSVGWPANLGGDTPSNWRPYDPVLERIDNTGRGHWIALHEYWGMNHGPSFYAGWWAYRYRHLLDYRPHTPIVLLEVAPTREYQSADGGWNLDAHDGWKNSISPQVAYDQYCEYDDEIGKDPSVAYATPFTLDGGHPWIEEYDINGLISIWQRRQTHWLVGQALPLPPLPTPEPPIHPPDLLPSGKLEHPLAGATISQHFWQNPDAYARFGLPGHNGVDLAGMPEGVPVHALANGEVAFVDVDPGGYGEYIRLYHEWLGAYSFYGHLMVRSPLRVGDAVQAGMPIGQVGNTGNSTGAHLHLEIRLAEAGGSYDANAPMAKGRVCPESWCAMHGLKL